MNLVPLERMEPQVKQEPEGFLVREGVLELLVQLVPVAVMEVLAQLALLVPLGLLDLLVSQVLLVPRVNLGLLVTPALLVLLVPVAKWGFQVFLAPLDLPVIPEQMGSLAPRVLLDSLVLLGLPGSLAPVVFLAPLVLLELLAPEDLSVNLVLLAPKEKPVTRESLALLEPKVLLVPAVKKEREGPPESLDLLALQGLQGSEAALVLEVFLELTAELA